MCSKNHVKRFFAIVQIFPGDAIRSLEVFKSTQYTEALASLSTRYSESKEKEKPLLKLIHIDIPQSIWH